MQPLPKKVVFFPKLWNYFSKYFERGARPIDSKDMIP